MDDSEPDVYAGGDPAMGSIGIGHDYVETMQTQSEIEAAETTKGKPLTDAETSAILAKHPSADVSIATGPQSTRAFGRWVKALPGMILGAIPWWLWAILLLALAILLAPYAKIASKVIPSSED